MWSKKHIALLIALWVILDYQVYILMHKRSYPLVALILVIVGLVSARRSGVEDMMLRVPTRDDWRLVGWVLSAFMVTLVPLALALGFIQWNPTPAHLRRGLIEPIPIFVFVALPEEIIFRGVIQKKIGRASCRERVLLIV